MVYVLKGWIKTAFDGQGAIVMRKGSCWIQPPRIEHKVLDYSDDCEVLEIVLPADFKTVELE
jgi:quercetin dioxygenase-like cupin family protein